MTEEKITLRLAAQTRAVITALEHGLRTLGDHHPLDRLLSAYFKTNRHLGSRDRRSIGEMLFALMRWWGWVEPMTPDVEGCKLVRSGPGPEGAGAWPALLLTLTVLERHEDGPLLAYWEHINQQPEGSVATWNREEDPRQRLRLVRVALGSPLTALPAITDILPAWARQELGDGAHQESEARWILQRPPLWLRAQPGALDAVLEQLLAAKVTVEQHPCIPTALNLGITKPNLSLLAPYQEGRLEVQDLASQAVGLMCAPRAGEQWWDTCAGGGGKSLHLAALMEGRGRVTATDTRASVLRNLRVRAERSGLSNIHTQERDVATQPAPHAEYDGVLVDVPCTGSGRWRRAPDRMWAPGSAATEKSAERQGVILRNTARHVRTGGVLVYATCSIFQRENEHVIASFLTDHPTFTPDAHPHPLTGAKTNGIIRVAPGDGDCNGMFMARLRRRA